MNSTFWFKIYVEMEELVQEGDQMEWKEKARWIKYEEDVEMGGKWGKPHAASLTFHSLLELRKCLERGRCLSIITEVLTSTVYFILYFC